MCVSVSQVAKRHWAFWHQYLKKGCMHGENCSKTAAGGCCKYGSRMETKHIISGGVFTVPTASNTTGEFL